MIQLFWLKVFRIAASHISWERRKLVGARVIASIKAGRKEMTLTVENFDYPNYETAYSREELIEMLDLIRRCEKVQGWKVPEMPKMKED